MSGLDLFNTLIDSTGLDQSTIRAELMNLLDQKNIKVEDLNLNILREVMAHYLLDNMPTLHEC